MTEAYKKRRKIRHQVSNVLLKKLKFQRYSTVTRSGIVSSGNLIRPKLAKAMIKCYVNRNHK